MSQGAGLVQTIHRVSYLKASEFQGDSLDWEFEYDGVVPFLEWFCDKIHPSICCLSRRSMKGKVLLEILEAVFIPMNFVISMQRRKAKE